MLVLVVFFPIFSAYICCFLFYCLSRDEVRAMAAKLSDAEAAEAKARAGIDTATCRVSSLEEAMDAAEAERADVVRRLTRKDGDLVAVRIFYCNGFRRDRKTPVASLL